MIKDMVTLMDKVEYQNLIPDTEYRMEGRVMDKNTGEALVIADLPVKAERVFKPKKPSGSIDVEFTFQSKGAGGIRETLYDGQWRRSCES